MRNYFIKNIINKKPFKKLINNTLRSIYIKTEQTPNPSSLKFFPVGKLLLDEGTMDFQSPIDAHKSPLAKLLFRIDNVKGVFLANKFLTISKDESVRLGFIKIRSISSN